MALISWNSDIPLPWCWTTVILLWSVPTAEKSLIMCVINLQPTRIHHGNECKQIKKNLIITYDLHELSAPWQPHHGIFHPNLKTSGTVLAKTHGKRRADLIAFIRQFGICNKGVINVFSPRGKRRLVQTLMTKRFSGSVCSFRAP